MFTPICMYTIRPIWYAIYTTSLLQGSDPCMLSVDQRKSIGELKEAIAKISTPELSCVCSLHGYMNNNSYI